jgi:(S)-ureidoglycine aminohydrolase
VQIIFSLAVVLLPAVCVGQLADISSKKYSWANPTVTSGHNIMTSVIFEGAGHDMEFIQMSANAITPSGKKTSGAVPVNEEHLLIMKSGTLNMGMGDSTWSIGKGSIALLIPGQKYFVQNATRDSCTFYLMKYRSRLPINPSVTKSGSFVKDWKKVVFRSHDRGGIRNYFEKTTPMSKRFEMHVTTLKEGIKSHEPHTHPAEEIVLVIENKTEMQIGNQFYKGGAGDIYYLGSNMPHAIQNVGKGTCTYFAFQFE